MDTHLEPSLVPHSSAKVTNLARPVNIALQNPTTGHAIHVEPLSHGDSCSPGREAIKKYKENCVQYQLPSRDLVSPKALFASPANTAQSKEVVWALHACSTPSSTTPTSTYLSSFYERARVSSRTQVLHTFNHAELFLDFPVSDRQLVDRGLMWLPSGLTYMV